MDTMLAPIFRNPPPTASKSGPLPASTIRLPATGQPCLASDCRPPGAKFPGRVHPGNGRNNSRAPVARINRSHSICRGPVGCSASKIRRPPGPRIAHWSNNKALDRRNRSAHRAACGRVGRACCPRQICPPSQGVSSTVCSRGPGRSCQICPPSQGVSSTNAVRRPFSAAAQAAARPAGPAPTTTTSKRSRVSFIGPHLHRFLAHGLAAPAMCLAVDGHPALHANSHPAQRSARFASNRAPKARLARLRDSSGDNRPRRHENSFSIDAQLDLVSHG